MTMERSNSTASSSSRRSSFNSSTFSSSFSTMRTSKYVLSVECLKGSSKSEEWTDQMLQTGDIVEEFIVGNLVHHSPFKNGSSGVQKILRDYYKSSDTSIRVRVRRSREHELTELQACIVPKESGGGKKKYIVRSIDDPNYAVGFVDRTETECLDLQGKLSYFLYEPCNNVELS